MATITHISPDAPFLGCSNSLLWSIAERALPHTQHQDFIVALEETEWLGDINLYLLPAECRLIFAEAADALGDEVETSSGEFPGYVARLRRIAAEVRKTVTVAKEGNP